MSTPPPPLETPAPIARSASVVGLVCGVASAIAAFVPVIAIPLGIAAIVISWRAAQRARGVDRRTISFAVGGLVAGTAGLLLGLASAFWGGATTQHDPVVLNGIETSTPDKAHQPQLDLDPGATCTVDLDGLHTMGSITNHTGRAWGYRVKVVWENEGTTLADATTLLKPISPGASMSFTMVSAAQTGTAATTCRVTQIDRS